MTSKPQMEGQKDGRMNERAFTQRMDHKNVETNLPQFNGGDFNQQFTCYPIGQSVHPLCLQLRWWD